MDYNEIVEQFSAKIDDLKYTDKDKSWDVSEDITIGWRRILPEPPKNTSKRTLMELEYLAKLTKDVDNTDEYLIKLVDKEPLDLFNDTLRKNNLEFDRADFKKIWNVGLPIIMNLKHQYNRARPEQLAPLFGLTINVQKTSTHQTPAYPSGHTAYTAFAAYLLSDMYPRFSSEFFHQVGVAGYARCVQGVHYPSDNEASMIISGAIWEDIRYKLFPNLASYNKERKA